MFSYFKNKSLYNLKRMPKPQLPMVSFWRDIIVNAITISIIAFSINASLSVLFANKHKYKTSAKQVLKS
jgi:hypothetical protein